jgi:diguanylate cyclase (GGDEF)-like protein/PAS domain S-box-containing protein
MPKSLQISAENVALALSAAHVGVWDWRGAKGFEQINARWSQIIGYEVGELDTTGFNWYAHVHPEDLTVVHTLAAEQASRSPEGMFEIEFRMRHKLGHWVWIQSRGKIVEWDANGKPSRFAGTHIDITERRLIADELKRAHATALESEARFRSLTELSSDWYWEQDTEFRFIDFLGNQQTALRRVEIAYGKTRWDLMALNLTEADWEAHRQELLAHRPFHNFEILRRDAAGGDYWISISGIPFYGADGQFAGYRGVGRNITAQKSAQETIRRLAYYDSLTKLPNRQLLMERLSDAVSICKRQQDQSALLFIDLDGFKSLNDTKGHPVGDILLSQVGGRLKSAVREVDTVARLGGDEFVVILNALSSTLAQAANQARTVGQKMLIALSEPYDLHGLDYRCTSSMGITLFGGADLDLEQILQRADLAMYQAKADGRNQLRFFDPAMQLAVEQRSALEDALRLGLLRNEFCLHYQPIVDSKRQLIGAEALARWNHPERGLVMPVEFIQLAESSGLILQLGAQMLHQACAQLERWSQSEATSQWTLAVNVSARQFREHDFVALVSDALNTTHANPARLKLELTESLLLNDVQDVVAKMHELKRLGVGFSLDDFGTGYSSLSYLKSLPLEQLKIDKGFVRDVLTDPSDAAIAISILTLAQALNLRVVAEGVETEGQLQFLLANGCKAFQGYLFGKPVPVGDLRLVPDAGAA